MTYASAGHVGIEEEPRRREEMPHLDVASLQVQACDRLHMNVGSRQRAARALCRPRERTMRRWGELQLEPQSCLRLTLVKPVLLQPVVDYVLTLLHYLNCTR
jgi:hypothetical protein